VIVTEVPTGPDDGLRFVIFGLAGITVKFTPLLGVPPTVTMTLPVVAEGGAIAAILVSLQLDTPACEPLNVTALVPCVAPKPVPEIVTKVDMLPDVGFRLVILGFA